jgi:glyoxylase-like metal-dependent hydrolase (beta-lactamase superfamily II)
MIPIQIELPTPFAVGPVNAYLFTEPEPVLIDTGVQSQASWAALTAGLAEHGLSPADLQRIIITHPHEDHCGQAGLLLDHSSADLWIWEEGVDWLLHFTSRLQERMDYYEAVFLPRTGMPLAMRQVVLGYFREMLETYAPIPAQRVHTFGLDDTLIMGGLAWQILHMPGHAHTQTCFYQPDSRQFISADMLLHRAPTPVVEHPPAGQPRPPGLPLFLQSLEVVEKLAIDTVYPGHGPIFHDPLDKISQQRKRIERRKQHCLKAISAGHQTLMELTNHLYANREPTLRFAGLWMIVGYLDLLQAEGRVHENLVDGVWRYSVTSKKQGVEG